MNCVTATGEALLASCYPRFHNNNGEHAMRKAHHAPATEEVTMRKKMFAIVPVVGAMLLSIGSVVTATPNQSSSAYRFEEVQWIWLKADLDADGRLTREEVWEEDATLAAKFDGADLDGDNSLSAAEFEFLLMTA
jgi:hypothetical protein